MSTSERYFQLSLLDMDGVFLRNIISFLLLAGVRQSSELLAEEQEVERKKRKVLKKKTHPLSGSSS